MSYALVTDNDRCLGQLATISGYSDMLNAAEKHGTTSLRMFFEEGGTGNIPRLKKDVEHILRKPLSRNVKVTYRQMLKMLENAGTFVFVGE